MMSWWLGMFHIISSTLRRRQRLVPSTTETAGHQEQSTVQEPLLFSLPVGCFWTFSFASPAFAANLVVGVCPATAGDQCLANYSETVIITYY